MSQVNQNQITRDSMPGGEQSKDFLEAAQSDLVALGLSYQGNRTTFPAVPSSGFFATRKGMYEAVYTDDPAPLPRWRRLSNGVLYQAGDNIPVTL